MKTYKLTVFEQTGKLLLEETFTAVDDEEACFVATNMLEENGYAEQTHRLTASTGKLLLFHS